jgi:FtsP/CotA-like multicopper oxidase with cupredoxin domain
MPRTTVSLVTAGIGGVVALAILGWYAAGPATGRTHTYFLAADELDWDYVPGGTNAITGTPFAGLQAILVTGAPDRIGRVYRKAIYREYTDSSFTTLKPRPPAWEHLGMLGPLLRAEVGDTIRVVFRNNGSHPYTLHPHGVFYTKSSEGAPYTDGTSGADKADDAVPPGGTHVYVWPVPERAGPARGEGSSILWMYHSHAEETRDVNAGLIDESGFFQVSHHVPDRGRAPAVAVREPIGEHARPDRLAGDQMFLDQGGKQHFGPRIQRGFVRSLKI